MRLRRVASTALVLALATALTGCGDDESTDAPQRQVSLTEAQLKTALIAAADLGGRFETFKPSEMDASGEDVGCLNALEQFDKGLPGSTGSVTVDLRSKNKQEGPGINQQVDSFADVAAATKVLNDIRSSLADCHAVDEESEGVKTTATVTSDDTKSGTDVDDQLNLKIAAKYSAGDDFDFELWSQYKLVRVGNLMTVVSFLSPKDRSSDDIEKVVDLALERLIAVMDGKAPAPKSITVETYTS